MQLKVQLKLSAKMITDLFCLHLNLLRLGYKKYTKALMFNAARQHLNKIFNGSIISITFIPK
nr:hypothetical protein EP46_06645 [Pantoea sp. 3.5.1]